MGVDVLVTGHTHKLDIWQGRDGGLYINPGSVSYRFPYLHNYFFKLVLTISTMVMMT